MFKRQKTLFRGTTNLQKFYSRCIIGCYVIINKKVKMAKKWRLEPFGTGQSMCARWDEATLVGSCWHVHKLYIIRCWIVSVSHHIVDHESYCQRVSIYKVRRRTAVPTWSRWWCNPPAGVYHAYSTRHMKWKSHSDPVIFPLLLISTSTW